MMPAGQRPGTARVAELVMVLGAAGLRPELVTVDGDVVTVTSPDDGDATITSEADEYGPFWEVRRHDSGGQLAMSAQLHDGHGVAEFLLRAHFPTTGPSDDGQGRSGGRSGHPGRTGGP